MRRVKKSSILWTVIAITIYLVLSFLLTGGLISSSNQISLVTIGINIILAVSLNLILGMSGQFSLGHAGFMAIGAYSTAVVLQSMDSMLGFVLGSLIGLLLTALFSLVVAIPTIRLKGDYLAIATLGAAEIIRVVITNLDSITNGAAGISLTTKHTNFTLLYLSIVFCIFIVMMLNNSRFGRAWKSVREDDIAASAMGVNVTRYKVVAFVIGGLFASLAGSLYAGYFPFISPDVFDFNKSVDILVIVVLGGMGSVTGSVIAAFVLGIINIALQEYASVRMIIYALLLIGMMILRPKGILGNYEFSFERRKTYESVDSKPTK